MLKRPIVIILSAAVGLIGLGLYLYHLPPPGVEPMGEENTIAWISLTVAILSLATTLVGLIQKIIELNALKKG